MHQKHTKVIIAHQLGPQHDKFCLNIDQQHKDNLIFTTKQKRKEKNEKKGE